MTPRKLLCIALSHAAVLSLINPVDAQTKREKRVGPIEVDDGGSCDTSTWKLVFSDEFEGTRLDDTKWRTWFPYSDDGSDHCEGCRLMGTSNTIFRDDLVSVGDGLLHMGVRARSGEWYGQAKEHEGSIIHSIGTARFNYGRFEVRCRIPKGAGLWPAFWGFGGETEIDVFEICGERTRVYKTALHRWGKPKFSNNGKERVSDLSQEFHVFAVEWERDGVRWYVDEELVQYRGRFVDKRGRPMPACERVPGEHHSAPYFPRGQDDLSIILDLAVSGAKGFCNGPVQPQAWPEGTSFDVDYVRVYQRGGTPTPP
ncbi:MAG: glycoside hydrolase family 16 protein [Flavobacteriales bacterium]|nr:glycoside hydrolase family 16 protein [Flavobacteriales bacterium]